MARILGIDHGNRWVGLALSDPTGTLARPLEVLELSPKLWAALREIIAREEVERIVLGLPVNMDGTVGTKAKQVLGWTPRVTFKELVRLMVDADMEQEGRPVRPPR